MCQNSIQILTHHLVDYDQSAKPGLAAMASDGVAWIVLLKDVGLAAVGAFETRASCAAQVKPAMAFECEFAGAFVEDLGKQLILCHVGYCRFFGCAAVVVAGSLESEQVVGGIVGQAVAACGFGGVEEHLCDAERACVGVGPAFDEQYV